MTIPITYNMYIYQGASWVLKTTFRDSTGAALDLTSYAAKLQIRKTETSSEALLTLESTSSNPGILLSNNDPFNLIVRITDEQTLSLPTSFREVSTWGYDLVLWEVANRDYTTFTLLTGKVIVKPLNTRPRS